VIEPRVNVSATSIEAQHDVGVGAA
jgi:hypothetical protein